MISQPHFSPYARFQLERYGNVLAPNGRDFIEYAADQEQVDEPPSASEDAYIFSQLNPE